MTAACVRGLIRPRRRRWEARLLALRLLAACIALSSMGLPARVPAAAAQVPMDIALAIQLVKQHAGDPASVDVASYSQARALLFKNNPLIQEGALNGYIPNDTYQAIQSDYAALNESFASQAAADVGAKFTKQVSKTPSCYSPGTDSDYLVDVSSPEQVAQMQANYNQYVSQYLDAYGVLDPSEYGTQWHKQLDTDFMATDTS
jgi:hypothetical protein